MRESEYYYDCSSFVSRLYSKYFGLSRLDYGRGNSGTSNIYTNCHANFTQVSMNDIQPGDILWRDGHVALYIGNNQTAEAASTNSGIVVRTVGNFTEVYRIIK
ncbi:Murein DD-endopeptidase MepS/Murein LD-carboxypeptidase precursor [compost metagenome]